MTEVVCIGEFPLSKEEKDCRMKLRFSMRTRGQHPPPPPTTIDGGVTVSTDTDDIGDDKEADFLNSGKP